MKNPRNEILGARTNSPFPLVDAKGNLVGPFEAMAQMGEIGHNLSRLGASLRFGGTVEPAEREAIILWVAWFRQNEFEEWAHRRVVEAERLIPEGLVEDLCNGRLGRVEKTSLGDAVSVANAVLHHNMAYLHAAQGAGHEVSRVREIICLVKYYDLLATIMEVEDIGIPEV